MITRTGGLVKYMMISMYDPTLLKPKEKDKLIADFQSIYDIERDDAETRIMNLRLT